MVREDLKEPSAALPVLVLFDKAETPPEFLPLLPFDLSDWDGAESHAELQNLLCHLRKLIPPSPLSPAPPASIEELSLSEIQESARRGITEQGENQVQQRLSDSPAAIINAISGTDAQLYTSVTHIYNPADEKVKDATGAEPEGDKRFRGVFISYRRSEAAAYAGRLYDRLAARFGREKVFIDTENVGWGEDFVEAITAAAESCAVMIALVSREWSRGAGGREDVDDYVRLEVATALGRKIRVIPILIQGASMPAPKDLPEDLSPLARRNALALSDTRWERDVEDLVKSLEKLLKD